MTINDIRIYSRRFKQFLKKTKDSLIMDNSSQVSSEKHESTTQLAKNKTSLNQQNHFQEIHANIEKTAKDLEMMNTSLQIMKYEFAKMNAQYVKIESYLALHKKLLNDTDKKLEENKMEDIISEMDDPDMA